MFHSSIIGTKLSLDFGKIWKILIPSSLTNQLLFQWVTNIIYATQRILILNLMSFISNLSQDRSAYKEATTLTNFFCFVFFFAILYERAELLIAKKIRVKVFSNVTIILKSSMEHMNVSFKLLLSTR